MDHARRRRPGDVDFCEDDCPRCGSCRVRIRTDAAGEESMQMLGLMPLHPTPRY